MAHIETRWVCPVCRRCFDHQREARSCAASHVREEKWAVSDIYPSKEVACNYRGAAFALREADKPDITRPITDLLIVRGGRSNGQQQK